MQNSVAIPLYVYSASVTLCSNDCNGKERITRPVVFCPIVDQGSVKPIINGISSSKL